MCLCIHISPDAQAMSVYAQACLVQSGALLFSNRPVCVCSVAKHVYVCALEQKNVILNVSHKSGSQLL